MHNVTRFIAWRSALVLLLALGLFACKGAGNDEENATPASAKCSVVVKESECDKTKRPIVFVHGIYGSGDQMSKMAMLFGSNGYCQDRFVAVEYNSLISEPSAQLDALVNDVLTKTGADKVELAGHSEGTGHCGTYMSDPAHAAKIAHYLNFSGVPTVPDGIPALSISSENDLKGASHHATGSDVKQVTLVDEDHTTLAASPASFKEVWKFLYNEEPKYTTIQCGEDPVTIVGIAETFGDNVPVAGKMEVYELNYNAGPDQRDKPVMTLTNTGDGHVGPIQLKRNVPYEFKAWDATGKLVGYVYFPPFKRSNYLARYLKPSDMTAVAMVSTDHIVKSPDHVAITGRNLGGAFRFDMKHSLKIDGLEVLTDENAGRADDVVGFFMYDADSNKKTDLGAVFGPISYLVGTDVYVDATVPKWINIEWNDPTTGEPPLSMKIPNWPSSEALILLFLW